MNGGKQRMASHCPSEDCFIVGKHAALSQQTPAGYSGTATVQQKPGIIPPICTAPGVCVFNHRHISILLLLLLTAAAALRFCPPSRASSPRNEDRSIQSSFLGFTCAALQTAILDCVESTACQREKCCCCCCFSSGAFQRQSISQRQNAAHIHTSVDHDGVRRNVLRSKA